ncbi:unnamed protein product [Arabidopsis lyrata]|uniref:putative F-box protein PP2-B12 isoform X2 n=1 Tax=Arabidopsis lyrata subsp. lyrata TaxID=81972 RepID=UPI000A29BB00|nr:putative F-box protein PP2-B12 isoform X2 [Arabidopsis lyrata subsp. lyrata]CAH8272118.1 unnamed protein product [Arabidopsis lyrata]|eukprot:XP_020879512.1 putative F-box protein PP2-B12 isoform X2 [Arabidopsis lyrata subsp. lyrata]
MELTLYLKNKKWDPLDFSLFFWREDGWLEIGVGEYYVGSDDEELEMSVLETIEGGWKGGIIVQGIEIRPKEVLGLDPKSLFGKVGAA